ncbi:hypothetical protein KKB18_08275 [bacterium]|nr:hypothetical protein [bacterium]
MEITIENEKNCCKIFKANLSKEEVEKDFTDAYKEINRNAVIPGFRKGKAPLSLVRNHYKKTATEDLKNELPVKYFREYSEKNNISHLGEVTVRTVTLDEDKGMKFTLVFETMPDLSVIDLSKISIHEVKDKEVTVEDIEAATLKLRKAYAVLSPIPEGSLVEEGNRIKFDYTIPSLAGLEGHSEKMEGIDIDEKKGLTFHDLEFELLEESIRTFFLKEDVEPGKIKEFIGHITQIKVGDEKVIKMKPPYPLMMSPKQDEKTEEKPESKPPEEIEEVELTIKIKEAKKIDLPEVNDDFAQTVIKEKSVDKLREKIKEELADNNRENVRNEMKWAIFNEVFKIYPFDVPKSLVMKTFETIKKQREHSHDHEGDHAHNHNDEELENRYMLESFVATKIDIFLDYLIKKNGLAFSKEKLDMHLSDIAKMNDQELTPELRQKLGAQGIIKSLQLKLLNDEIVDFLLKNVVILPPKEEI